MMAVPVLLGLGWWLVAPSRVQGAFQLSLSLHPSPEVALGDTVTLRCHVPQPSVQVCIYKEGDRKCQWQRDNVEDMAEFRVDVSTWNFAGKYWCSSNITPLSLVWSAPVELVVLDPSLLPPVMSLSPGGRVTTGTSVTISCHSTYGVTFVLHKAGRSAPIQLRSLVRGTTATFTLPRVTQAEAGTYGCSYRPRENFFVSSHPRSEVTLELEPGGPGMDDPSSQKPAPQPLLSLHPSEEVALGDNVTFRCHLPRKGVQVIVYKEGDGNYRWQRDGVQDTTEVLVQVTTNAIAGIYRCRYETVSPTWATDWSAPVELVVLDASFPPPTLSLSPGGRVETGTNVTIHCQSPHGATFVLHKTGGLDPIQRVVSGNTATFTLRGVTQADTGTYGCSYRPQENPFISSYPRAEVTLEVATGAPSFPLHTPTPGTKEEPGRTLPVVGGSAAALVVSLGLIFLAYSWCRRRQRGTAQPERGSLQPMEDAEGLTYTELQLTAPSTPRTRIAPASSILYAEVVRQGPC